MCPKVTEQMSPEMYICFTIVKYFNNKKEYLH